MTDFEKTNNPDLEDKKKSRRRFVPHTPSDTPPSNTSPFNTSPFNTSPSNTSPSNTSPLWTKQYSEQYEEFYFYNDVTKESIWMNTPEGNEIAKMLKGYSPQKDEKTQKIIMAIDKMRKDNSPQKEAKSLKIIIPQPPSTPPPSTPTPTKLEGQPGMPRLSSSSSSSSDKIKQWPKLGNKNPSDDKLSWNIDANKLYEQQQREAPKELFKQEIVE